MPLKYQCKFIILISTQDKVLPIALKCLKVVFTESGISFCLSSFCASLAMKSSILRCHDRLILTVTPSHPFKEPGTQDLPLLD